jgi:hypothetical protein
MGYISSWSVRTMILMQILKIINAMNKKTEDLLQVSRKFGLELNR